MKRGLSYKRGSGNGIFKRKNWKQRYFVLNHDELIYYENENGKIKGKLDISECTNESLEIMPSEKISNGFLTPYKWFLILHTRYRLFYMSFPSEIEMNGWAFAFLQAFKMNQECGRPTYINNGQLRDLLKEQKNEYKILSRFKMDGKQFYI